MTKNSDSVERSIFVEITESQGLGDAGRLVRRTGVLRV